MKERKVPDPNAKAMWGRCRSQVYQPKKGGRYSRKIKHKCVDNVE